MGDCSTFDVQCHISSAFANVLEQTANTFSRIGWEVMTGAFGGTGGTISGDEWNVATAMASKWGLILLIVVVIIGLIRVTQAAIQGDMRVAISAGIWAMAAWPITMLAIWATIVITNATDALTIGILNDGSGDVADSMNKLFSVTVKPTAEALGGGDLEEAAITTALTAVICGGGTLLATVILGLMLAFRNFALLVLIGFSPLAFMALPMEALRGWMRQWLQAVVALVVAKPLAAGILVMSHAMLGTANDLWGWVVGIVAILMAAFAPIITMGMFQWAGGQTAANYGSHSSAVASNTVGGVTRVGRSAANVVRK